MNQLSIFDVMVTSQELIGCNRFYNTIHLEGKELTEAKVQTGLQDQRVLGIFGQLNDLATPFEVHKIYQDNHGQVCITSIRRSITVLTGKGLLIKTNEMRKGGFGKKNFCWKLA